MKISIPNEVLLIQSAYNNLINGDIIEQYRDRIIFSYIDYKNMEYIIKNYNIINYYSFFEMLPNFSQIKIINYYSDNKSISRDIVHKVKNSKNIITVSKFFPLTWLNYNEHNAYFIFKDSLIYNIPKFLATRQNTPQ